MLSKLINIWWWWYWFGKGLYDWITHIQVELTQQLTVICILLQRVKFNQPFEVSNVIETNFDRLWKFDLMKEKLKFARNCLHLNGFCSFQPKLTLFNWNYIDWSLSLNLNTCNSLHNWSKWIDPTNQIKLNWIEWFRNANS